jgi:leucine dehydrogenase
MPNHDQRKGGDVVFTARAGGIEQRIRNWDGQSVVVAHDNDTDAWVFVAIHDVSLGPAVGGTRVQRYPQPEDGLVDAMRLAEGMTYKWAGIDMPFGGGKAVLALSRDLDEPDRHGLLRRYGRILGSLCGAFSTGVDLGTTPEDMLIVASQARYVVGVEEHQSADPGPFTALGVLSGIRSSLREVFGSESLPGRTILIQGVGDVGLPLAHMLAEAGARVLLSDLDEGLAARVAAELDGQVVLSDALYETECDVFAPSAIGAILNPETVPVLRCRIVAGPANNQLESLEDADRLHQRGILYAPDYIINAGGAIAFGRMHLGQTDMAVLRREVQGIETTLEEVFREAREANEAPVHAAQRRARRVLEEARSAPR